MKTTCRQILIATALVCALTMLGVGALAHAAGSKPNILIIVARAQVHGARGI